jgi:hypothetical protein
MPEKPSKPAKLAKSAKPAKRAKSASKPGASGARTAAQRTASQHEIAVRAYFIHLEEGGRDELENWLRAERELTAD